MADLWTEDQWAAFLTRVIGAGIVADTDLEVFIRVQAVALTRLAQLIQDLPQLRDLDRVSTEFLLAHLQPEFGASPPHRQIDTREFLREAKSFASGMGATAIIQYLGQLTGTLVESWEPSRFIWRYDGAMLWDGLVPKADQFPMPDPTSRLGRYRDGVFWAFHTYVVNVYGAQNVPVRDVTNYIDYVHPAGTKPWPFLHYQSTVEAIATDVIGSLTTIFVLSYNPVAFGTRHLGIAENLNGYTQSPITSWQTNVLTKAYPPEWDLHDDETDSVVLNHISVVASLQDYRFDNLQTARYALIKTGHYSRTPEDWRPLVPDPHHLGSLTTE